LINQPIEQSFNQPINQSINQPNDQTASGPTASANQLSAQTPMDHLINLSTPQSMPLTNQFINQSKN